MDSTLSLLKSSRHGRTGLSCCFSYSIWLSSQIISCLSIRSFSTTPLVIIVRKFIKLLKCRIIICSKTFMFVILYSHFGRRNLWMNRTLIFEQLFIVIKHEIIIYKVFLYLFEYIWTNSLCKFVSDWISEREFLFLFLDRQGTHSCQFAEVPVISLFQETVLLLRVGGAYHFSHQLFQLLMQCNTVIHWVPCLSHSLKLLWCGTECQELLRVDVELDKSRSKFCKANIVL